MKTWGLPVQSVVVFHTVIYWSGVISDLSFIPHIEACYLSNRRWWPGLPRVHGFSFQCLIGRPQPTLLLVLVALVLKHVMVYIDWSWLSLKLSSIMEHYPFNVQWIRAKVVRCQCRIHVFNRKHTSLFVEYKSHKQKKKLQSLTGRGKVWRN